MLNDFILSFAISRFACKVNDYIPFNCYYLSVLAVIKSKNIFTLAKYSRIVVI
jgi:hypothetical protein